MEFTLDHLVLVFRSATTPKDAPIGTKGDVVEIHCAGGPVKEVDPISRSCRDANQCFRCDANGAITPVKRGSWDVHVRIPQRAKAKVNTALEAYQRKSGIVSAKARML